MSCIKMHAREIKYNRKVAVEGYVTFSLVTLLFMNIFLAINVEATKVGNQWTGPWIDKLKFRVIQNDTEQVHALINGDVDIIGGQLNPVFLNQLYEVEDIEVAEILHFGYGIIQINCNKYPMNITNFRRAVAFATDKHRIIEEGWLGLAQPLDCHIPRQHPASIEEDMTYHYYDENIEEGARLLEQAGFIDSDDNGWLEGPGPAGAGTVKLDTIVVEGVQNAQNEIFLDVIITALLNLNISAETRLTPIIDWYDPWQHLWGDYDMIIHEKEWSDFDLDFYARDMSTGYINTPVFNIPNWSNESWDELVPTVLHSTDYDEIIKATKQMEHIWVHSCPAIAMYQSTYFTAFRKDRFDSITPTVLEGAPNFFTNDRVQQKDDDSVGGTYIWANPLDILSFNHYSVNSAYASNILQMLFDPLVRIGPDGNDILWMCESYSTETHDDNSAVPENHTRIKVDVVQNATWSDGTSIAAEDFAFSLKFMRDNVPVVGADLVDMVECYTTSSSQLIIEFNSESYWHWHNVAYKRVIPKQVWIDYANAYDQYQPSPSNLDEMIISGAFIPTTWAQGEFVELSQNSVYFRNPRLLPEPSNTITTTSNHAQTTSSPNVPDLPISLQTASFVIVVYIVVIISLSVDYKRSKVSS